MRLLLFSQTISLIMRHNLISLLTGLVLTAGCSLINFEKTPEEQLPDITREGKNTFGCLVNGEAYVKCADDSSPIWGNGSPLHYEVILDTNVVVVLYTEDRCDENDSDHLESLHLQILINQQNQVINKRASYTDYSSEKFCYGDEDFRYHDSTSAVNFVKINYFHSDEGIVAGEFEFDLYTPGCTDTIQIRKGRFDIAF